MNRSEAGKLGAEKTRAIHKGKYLSRLDLYNKNPKLCRNCQKVLDYNKRYNDFCSQSCAATINNRNTVHNGKARNKNCIQCNKKLNENSLKYCSASCMADYRFENGFTKNSIIAARSYIIRHRGKQCEMCKNTHWLEKPIMLEIDHIDGNSNNNDLNNLRLLCPNCHSTTPTYKNRNQGNGRSYRRERYKDGKSY